MQLVLLRSTRNWRPRKRTKRDKTKRSNWRAEEIHNSGNGKRVFFIRGHWSSLVAQTVKTLSAMRETWVRSLVGKIPGGGHGNPLQCSCLENPWTEEPGRLQSVGLQRVRHNWATRHSPADSFRGTDLSGEQCTKVIGAVQNAIQATMPSWWEKKSYSQTSLDHFFFPQKSTYSWIQPRTRSCVVHVRHEWSWACPPFLIADST